MPAPPLILAAGLLTAALGPAQEPEPGQGTTLPIHRAHADQFADAARFLADGRTEAGIALLEELAAADPGELVPTADPRLFRGTSALALEQLAALPPAAQAIRRRLAEARAERAVSAALTPPDLLRLESLARQYAGLDAGARARAAAAELWLDRGQAERSVALIGSGAPALLLRPEAAAGPKLPAVGGADDAQLRALDTDRLELLWSHRFTEPVKHGAVVKHRLAIGNGVLYACDGYEASAFEAGSGRLLWSYQADPRWRTLANADLLREAVSIHLLNAPVLAEGILLAVMHEAEPLGRSDKYSNISIRRLMPARRLVALDARTGRLLWKMAADWDTPELEPRGMVAGPPAVAAGRVYVPVFDAIGTVDLRLLALDLRTGERLWQRFLASGQLETNLFGNVLMELAVPPPLADARTVQVCSHLGSFHALDSATGAVLWTRTYRRMEVRSTETGRIASRPQLLSRNLGVMDGSRVAWAPVDGESLYLLDAAGGSLLDAWPAVDALDRHLSVLLGMSAQGLWAAGSRLALLRPGVDASDQWSDPILEEGGALTLGRLGAMVQGAILLPWRLASVERFNATSFAHEGRAIDFAGEYLAAGSVQAGPGLLCVERPDGFAVYSSRATIAEAFRDARISASALCEILPIALQVEFAREPRAARTLMDGALRLAERADLAEEAPRLRLLAARAGLAAQEIQRAEDLLVALLDARDPEVAAQAAGLLLDSAMLAEPMRPGVAAALARTPAPNAEVQLMDGSRVPAAAAVARGRAVRALAGDDALDLLPCLTDLLLLDELGGLTVEGQPAHAWAAGRLQALLNRPSRREAYEQAGRAALQRLPMSEALLRAFGQTAAVQEELARELARTDLPRAEEVQRARWRREYGDPQRAWPDLARWFPVPEAPPPAPAALHSGATLRGASLAPLLVIPGPQSGALAWLRSGENVVLSAFTAQGAAELESFPRRSGLATEFAVQTPGGCAVLTREAIVHYGADGGFDVIPLPQPVQYATLPLALGAGLVAAVFEGAPGGLRLIVLDARTGTPYLQEDLPGDPGSRCELRREGRYLYLFEDKTARGYRVDLQFRGSPLAFGLPAPQYGNDLNTTVVGNGEVSYLVNAARSSAFVCRAGPGVEALQLPYEGMVLRRIRVQPGIAWAPVPASRDTAEAATREIHWLAPGAATPQVIPIGGGEARILQLVESEARRAPEYPADEILALRPETNGGVRILAFRLGTAGEAWSALLPEVSWNELHAAQPQPRRAADAWVLPLLLRATPERSQRLMLLVLEPGGRVRARAINELRGSGAEQVRLDLVPGAVLLRDGNTVTLYGDS